MVENGPNNYFGQNDLILNRTLAFAGPKWSILVHVGLKGSILVHLGPPTVLWPFLRHLRGWGKCTRRRGGPNPFSEAVSFVRFSSPLFSGKSRNSGLVPGSRDPNPTSSKDYGRSLSRNRSMRSDYGALIHELFWADPGVLWKKAPRTMRAMRGKTLETVPFQPYFGCTKSFLKVLSN